MSYVPKRNYQMVRLTKGGEYYRLAPAQFRVLNFLREYSPNPKPSKAIAESCKLSEETVRYCIMQLRDVCTMEGFIIEMIKTRGYRLLKVVPYDFSISH